MHFKIITLASTLVTLTNGAIVSFYSDGNCQDYYNSRNIYDNTCATGVGSFGSFMITTPSTGQILQPWNRDACAGPYAAFVVAGGDNANKCWPVTGTTAGWNGNANAMSGYFG